NLVLEGACPAHENLGTGGGAASVPAAASRVNLALPCATYKAYGAAISSFFEHTVRRLWTARCSPRFPRFRRAEHPSSAGLNLAEPCPSLLQDACFLLGPLSA